MELSFSLGSCSKNRVRRPPPEPTRKWRLVGLGVWVRANTKSEARARLKEKLEVGRLPVGCEIVEVK